MTLICTKLCAVFYDYGFDLYEGLCNFYVYGLDAYLVCSNLVPHQISICREYRQTQPRHKPHLPCPDSVVWRPPTASAAVRGCSRGRGSRDSSPRRLSPGRRGSAGGRWRPLTPTPTCPRSAGPSPPPLEKGAGRASGAGGPSWSRPPSRAWPCPVAAGEPETTGKRCRRPRLQRHPGDRGAIQLTFWA